MKNFVLKKILYNCKINCNARLLIKKNIIKIKNIMRRLRKQIFFDNYYNIQNQKK